MVETQTPTADAQAYPDQIARHLSDGLRQHNIDEAVREIYSYKKDHPSEFSEFVSNVNKALNDDKAENGELPGISLVDVDASGQKITVCSAFGQKATLSASGAPSAAGGEDASASSAPSEPRDPFAGPTPGRPQFDDCSVVVQKGDNLWKIARKLLLAKHKSEHPDDTD